MLFSTKYFREKIIIQFDYINENGLGLKWCFLFHFFISKVLENSQEDFIFKSWKNAETTRKELIRSALTSEASDTTAITSATTTTSDTGTTASAPNPASELKMSGQTTTETTATHNSSAIAISSCNGRLGNQVRVRRSQRFLYFSS